MPLTVIRKRSGSDSLIIAMLNLPSRVKSKSTNRSLEPAASKAKGGAALLVKLIVFGIFQRNGHVYTEIVPNCSKATLQAVIRGRVQLESVIYSNGWRGYNGLVDVGYGKHLRLDHGLDEFARGRTHINGIECFWRYVTSRLVRFRGMNPATFNLHLKECEFRFNHRGLDLYKLILKVVRQEPLKVS